MIYTYDGVYMFLKYNKRQDSIPATSNNLNSGMDDQQYYQCSKLCFIASTSTHLPSLKLREHLKQWGWKMSFLLERPHTRCYVCLRSVYTPSDFIKYARNSVCKLPSISFSQKHHPPCSCWSPTTAS